MGRVTKIEMIFYNSGGWEPNGAGRIACGGGVNSMLQFQLERGSDETKRCRKMNVRQRVLLGSM
jgi:hypothetical protein